MAGRAWMLYTFSACADETADVMVNPRKKELARPLKAVEWYCETLLSGECGRLNKLQARHIKDIGELSRRMMEEVESPADDNETDL
jgi:hypothetical protein